MARTKLEVPVQGMDCAECTMHVQHALAALPGVDDVHVLLSSEKAVLQVDPAQIDLPIIRKAVEGAGYTVPESTPEKGTEPASKPLATFTRPILTLFGLVFGAVLLIVIVGEWLGFFERVTEWVPWYVGWGLVLLAGYPIFRNVIRATLHRQVISHTLMSLGVVAALAVGQWPTALVIVFFMRVGDYTEHFTTERSRQAVKRLTALAPQTARVERDGVEQVVPIEEVQVGETVIVRPGESIPVDGEVIGGQATVNQATLTGESMPVEVSSGNRVFAATIATLGSIRLKVTHVGADTTFGRVITMVEEAEATSSASATHRGSLLGLLSASRSNHCTDHLSREPEPPGCSVGAGCRLFLLVCACHSDCDARFHWGRCLSWYPGQRRKIPGVALACRCGAHRQDWHNYYRAAQDHRCDRACWTLPGRGAGAGCKCRA